jgi:hypothetical protein
MTHPSPDYSPQDLLAFYYRVKPILAEWLVKPVWTARETALLCAGYVPNGTLESGKYITSSQPDSIEDATSIDSCEYIPADRELYCEYLGLLNNKEATRPRDMVQLLRPISRRVRLMDVGGQNVPVEIPRPFRLEAIKEIQWFLIIANAVGLQVPALVPFSLLDRLRDLLAGQPVSESLTKPRIDMKKGEQPDIACLTAEAEPIQEVKPKAKQLKLRKRQPPQTTPEKRGYHTTEEVAGLTNLLPATLNKYAREGIAVEGFEPFKRQNGRSWHWRDDQQQAEYESNNNTGRVKHRPK